MISPELFSARLVELGFDTAVGVPDSTFKGLISYISTQNQFNHVIASNECEASAIAAGYYLAHQKPAVIYMQNSGFCKTLNPYTSLLADEVYGIPALMMVGWRGEPGKKDEPQHKMMGRIMIELFKTSELEYAVLSESLWENQLAQARKYIETQKQPYVIVVPKGLFDDFQIPGNATSSTLKREQVIEIIVKNASKEAVFISTTGKTSRELFEIRERRGEGHGPDFYTVGSMGCASSIAFGVGLGDSSKPIYILDGDGAALMQLGSMATIGHYKNNRLKHIIIDNNAHESTGGQPTVSQGVDFARIAEACGYENVCTVDNERDLNACLQELENNGKLSLLVVNVKKGSRKDLGRPTTTPKENRDAFIQNYNGQKL